MKHLAGLHMGALSLCRRPTSGWNPCEEAGQTMSRHALTFHFVDVLPMIGLALVFLWLWLSGISLRELLSHGALTVTGYLRHRPDPAVENALRAAFADLDKDLARILGDRSPRKGARDC